MRKLIIVLAAIFAPIFSYAAYTGGVLGGALIVPTWYAPDATSYVTISSHTRVSDGGSNYVDIDPIVGFSGPGAGLTDLDWGALTNFPASCAPQCVVAIGTTLTCGACSGGGGSGGGNAYTTGGVIGQIPVYVAVDSITASGLIPSQVALNNADNNFSATQTFLSSITAAGYIGTSSAYQINGSTVLRQGNISSIALGVFAGANDLAQSNNTYLGYFAGASNSLGSDNSFLGAQSGLYLTGTSDGNTLLGVSAGQGTENISSYDYNTFIGYASGLHISTGSYNVLMGYRAGNIITSGSENIIIGANSGSTVNPPYKSSNNYLNIGNEIYGDMTAGPITIKHGINPASVNLSTTASKSSDNNFSATQTFQYGIVVATVTATSTATLAAVSVTGAAAFTSAKSTASFAGNIYSAHGYTGRAGTGGNPSTTYGAHVSGGSLAAGASSGNQYIVAAGGNGSVEIVVLNMVTADGNYHVFDVFICSHGQSWNLQGATLLQKLTDGSLTITHSSGGWDVNFTNGTSQTAYWQIKSMNIVDLYSTKGSY